MNTTSILKCKTSKVIGTLAFVAMSHDLRAEGGGASKNIKTYVRFEPLPAAIGLGIGQENHRGGIFASRNVAGRFAYRSIGLEYAYHFSDIASAGLYAKVFAEHRQYDPGLEVNSHFVDEKGAWEHDVLGHHRANHFGAMLGYQWMLFSSSAFIQAGLGWQYNSNPVDIGGTMYGVGQSVKSRSEATGELGIGFLLN